MRLFGRARSPQKPREPSASATRPRAQGQPSSQRPHASLPDPIQLTGVGSPARWVGLLLAWF